MWKIFCDCRNALLALLFFSLTGCGHRFVDLNPDNFTVSKISKVELTVEKNNLLVRDNNSIGFFGAPFGILGWAVAELVEEGVNNSNEQELRSVTDRLTPYELKDVFAKRLEKLRGIGPFADTFTVATEGIDSLLAGIPRLTTKFVLAPQKKSLTLIAHIDYQQGQKKSERYNKTYISLQDLQDYGLTGSKLEIYEQLGEAPEILKSMLEISIDQIVQVIKSDMVSNKYASLPSIGSANYFDGDLVHLVKMEVLEDLGNRLLLRGAKKPARVVVMASKSLINIK